MNKQHSHCCVHNKAHKLIEDTVSGRVCVCVQVDIRLCVKGGGGPVLQKNFQC